MPTKSLLLFVFSIFALFLPAAPDAPQTNDGPIAIHPKHPQFAQKSVYMTRAEWPRPSTQAHWAPSESPIVGGALPGMLSHAHIECQAPIYGMIARAPISFDCQVQAFHLPGSVTVGSMGSDWANTLIEWDRPEPMIGDPHGLVVRQVRVTFGTAKMPESGVWRADIFARAQLDNGTRFDAMQEIPICVNCDGTEPEEAFLLTSQMGQFLKSSPLPGQHGGPTVDYLGFLPIIAPLTRRYEVPVRAFSYIMDQTFPGGGAFEQVHRPNLHFNDPGILVRRVEVPPPATDIILDAMIFDPVILGPGKSKVSAGWKDDTGTGNDRFLPNEASMAFIVVEVDVPPVGTPPPPPPPPPTATPCVGSWGYIQTSPTTIERIFTITAQPTNGGTSCAVVAAGAIGG